MDRRVLPLGESIRPATQTSASTPISAARISRCRVISSRSGSRVEAGGLGGRKGDAERGPYRGMLTTWKSLTTVRVPFSGPASPFLVLFWFTRPGDRAPRRRSTRSPAPQLLLPFCLGLGLASHGGMPRLAERSSRASVERRAL